MEMEQLCSLLRDLDALKQHPDDLTSTIDRVSLPSGCTMDLGSFIAISPSPVLFQILIPAHLIARCGSG
jgi:hypothetical protein